MVELNENRLDAVFHALGDATRRRMLRSLAEGERSVGELAEPFAMSLAAASKHVKALENAGLIRREIRGRSHVCRLQARALSAASAWLDHYRRFWDARLDALEQLLRQPEAQAAPQVRRSDTPAQRATPGRRPAPARPRGKSR